MKHYKYVTPLSKIIPPSMAKLDRISRKIENIVWDTAHSTWPRQDFPVNNIGHDHKIYILIDKRDSTVRYVGHTYKPEQREASHKRQSSGNKYLKAWKAESADHIRMHWIDSTASETEWPELEQKWKKYFRKRGKIYNYHKGGELDKGRGLVDPQFWYARALVSNYLHKSAPSPKQKPSVASNILLTPQQLRKNARIRESKKRPLNGTNHFYKKAREKDKNERPK